MEFSVDSIVQNLGNNDRDNFNHSMISLRNNEVSLKYLVTFLFTECNILNVGRANKLNNDFNLKDYDKDSYIDLKAKNEIVTNGSLLYDIGNTFTKNRINDKLTKFYDYKNLFMNAINQYINQNEYNAKFNNDDFFKILFEQVNIDDVLYRYKDELKTIYDNNYKNDINVTRNTFASGIKNQYKRKQLNYLFNPMLDIDVFNWIVFNDNDYSLSPAKTFKKHISTFKDFISYIKKFLIKELSTDLELYFYGVILYGSSYFDWGTTVTNLSLAKTINKDNSNFINHLIISNASNDNNLYKNNNLSFLYDNKDELELVKIKDVFNQISEHFQIQVAAF